MIGHYLTTDGLFLSCALLENGGDIR